ncbi:MAG: decaprenyl-phosphate phosphoribosyltransferase [Anaerolineae bacterium]
MLKPTLKTMRPKQWTKNLFIFAPLVFDEKLFQMNYLLKTVSGFILMCLLSSTVYIINDLVDIEKDRQHPAKRHRPLPSGQLSPKVAAGFAILLPLACLPLSFLLDRLFGLTALTYLTVMVAYSFFLKNVLIIDVLTIAAGFVLRVAGGVVLVDVVRFSPWLYLCTTLLALFLGLSKRRHELMLLQQNAAEHRSILNEYSPYLLDEMIAVVTSTTVIAYSLYTFTAPNMPKNHVMMLTIPFVLYGIFRYLYIIHQKNEGGSPEEILIKDIPLIADIVLWGLMVVLFLYLF